MGTFIDECPSPSAGRIGHPIGHVIRTTNFLNACESNQSLCAEHPAEHTRADNFPCALGFRDETTAEADRMAQPRPIYRFEHLLSIGDRGGQGFLAKHVLTRCNGIQDYLSM